ncbi:HTH-type transcriptional regulator VirS [Methyloligella halotolerans]|uniref:HTH-type transcriptional regulator VirS n=1 Tax=Methyloligella halotolerans TaxID=1177755 RepID=A0A1E2RWT8_9HYPH|nr:AraC family transcriptional regulator [Methyloligella halotolerans]ODA66529.1 HTH-type transcriptional regulator VirS [Methyloligella halotolerans]
MGSLPDLLEEREGGKALVRAFQFAEIPLAVRDNLDMPIPAAATSRLFAHGARQVGCRTFGLDVGECMGYRSFGSWADYGAAAETLAKSLRRLGVTTPAQATGMQFTLKKEGVHWVWRLVTPLVGGDAIQYSDHLIFPMLGLARVYLGPHWRPDWIEVNYSRDDAANLIEERLQVPMRFARPCIGIPFTPANLRQRRPEGAAIGTREALRSVLADVAMNESAEPARSFSAIVAMRLLDGQSDIDGAARLAGLSVQGLQRRLRQKGYFYREILDATRRSNATTLLRETNLSVSEIAYRLGYEEHANFSRAFRRWTGCSPNQFRMLRAEGGAL